MQNLKARVIDKTWQCHNCTDTSSSHDILHTEKMKESNIVQGTRTLSFLQDNIENTTNFLKVLPDAIMESRLPTSNYDPTQSLIDYPPRKNSNGKITRHYSFCYGHLPYTALFITFAPPTDAAPVDTDGTALKIDVSMQYRKDTNETKAHVILSKMDQRIPDKDDGIQNNSYTNFVPESFLTWKSKARTILPQQQDSNPIQVIADGTSANSMSIVQMKDKRAPLRAPITTTKEDFHDLEQIHLEDDNRSPMDKEVDKIQNFNDKIISSNGFHIIPFRTKEKDLSSLLYAGSMITELEQDLFMYICKPCDRAGFEQTDFLIHHTTTKHQNNTRTWIHQHYILPINKKEDETKNSHKDKFKNQQANQEKDHTRIQNLSTRNTEDSVQVSDPFK